MAAHPQPLDRCPNTNGDFKGRRMRRSLGFGLLVLCFACAPAVERALAEISAVEAAASEFVGYAHAFDYPAMRANATPDFEILIFGQRMGMDEFEALLRGLEERRGDNR